MIAALIVTSSALVLAWAPLARRFSRDWFARKNPVSLAFCAYALLAIYTNALCVLALTGNASWKFVMIATHIFEAVVVANFYAAFKWSDDKLGGIRGVYSVPPPNTESTPREL